MEYPWIERQRVWDKEFDFLIHDLRSDNWYSERHALTKPNNVVKDIKEQLNNWHPLLKKMMKEGDTVIDVGSNEGWMTCLFANRVGPTGKVISIEGDPDVCEFLRQNVERNNFGGYTTVLNNVAAEKTGENYFIQYEVTNKNGGKPVVSVALNDFAYLKPAMVKIDVEGYECPVLRGSEELLKLKTKFEIEMHLSPTTGVNMTNMGFDPQEILDILWKYDYKIFRVNGADLIPVNGMDDVKEGIIHAF